MGIIGGGQLARMMVPPAQRLGIEVWVLENSDTSPAGLVGAHHLKGDWRDPKTCADFARGMDVVTLDHEFAPLQALMAAEAESLLLPSVSTMACIADKLEQKRHLQEAGIPTVKSRGFSSADELRAVAEEYGFPLMVKTRAGGYDGKGNFTLKSAEQIPKVFEELKGDLYAEKFLRFERELAVMVARTREGEVTVYPVVETVQENHICVSVHFPAALSGETVHKAEHVAHRAAQAVKSVGVLGVEMFLRSDGEVLVNELAPRPHNSGHYTLDCCLTSQFENHVRAVCGLPLGSVQSTVEGGVMVNLLGDGHGSGRPHGLEKVLENPRARMHLYGKTAKPGRKLGHLTVVGSESLAELQAQADELLEHLTFKETQEV